MLRENYYDILGVPPTANLQDIRKAYTTLVLQYHPDKNESDDARDKFEAIQRAYETLSDDKKRENYNALLRRQTSLYCPTTSTSPGQRPDDRDSGGTIITGDGWSFAINLNNISVSKLVFTFAEDGDIGDPHIDHIVVKTKPSTPEPSGASCGTKRRQTVFDIPGRVSRDGDRGPGKRSTRDATSNINVPQRTGSGKKQPAAKMANSSPRLSSPESRGSGRIHNRGQNVPFKNVDPQNPAVSTKRRKTLNIVADRKRPKPTKPIANVPSKTHVASCPKKKAIPPTNLKNTFAKTDLTPIKLNLNTRGNFAFPQKVNIGSKTNLLTANCRTAKPKLLATRTIVGKFGSDRNMLGLFARKSSNFQVKPTLFAVRSRLFGPLLPPQNKQDIENKPKRKVVNEAKKKTRKPQT